jgi:hypothetical protein
MDVGPLRQRIGRNLDYRTDHNDLPIWVLDRHAIQDRKINSFINYAKIA